MPQSLWLNDRVDTGTPQEPLMWGFFSVSMLESFLEICNNLKNIFFSLPYFIIRMNI